MQTGNWNRASRKSGGDRGLSVHVNGKIRYYDDNNIMLSIQCFEKRHVDCPGDCKPFGPDKCDCRCHSTK